MTRTRILIQDIADSLKLSRTTVSKVLNGNTSVSEKTRNRVIEKAKEMNYRFLPISEDTSAALAPSAKPAAKVQGNLGLLFHKLPDQQHIGSILLTSLEQEISKYGYTLSLFTILDDDIRHRRLPGTFIPDNVDAIVCLELFDLDYSRLLCSLNKPLLFIDAYHEAPLSNFNADILMMESGFSLSTLVSQTIRQNNITRAGFVGAPTHCLSFYERWKGFLFSLQKQDLEYNKSLCIIHEDDEKYWDRQWLISHLKIMDPLPDLFVCANDSLAIQLISCLKEINVMVPRDLLITGFDNVLASRLVEPHLSTIDSHSELMGITAAKMIMDRCQNPTMPFLMTYLATDIIERESSRRCIRRT